ncbi:hypothetical protein Tco_1464089, partial [Tanacetum coccineum]
LSGCDYSRWCAKKPRNETASRRDWFKKPTPPQEPTDPDWNVGKTTKEGPTQTWLMNLAASNPTDKSLKNFDELMSTPIDFSSFALSEKLDWENPEGDDYPFDLSKPLPLITCGKRQRVPFEFFINNDRKYLQGGISTMTYTTSTTKTKAAKYNLPGIEDMVPNIWSPVKVAYDKYALWGISIGENNVSPSMLMHEAFNQEEMCIRQSVFWQSLMSR